MTISGWIAFALLGTIVLVVGVCLTICFTENKVTRIIVSVITIGLIVGLFFGMRWYFQNTASGQRALTDQKSNFNNGIERVITVYTADGKVIAQYEGRIDIEGNDGGYVVFDYEGHRYTYYNCFVESVASIE